MSTATDAHTVSAMNIDSRVDAYPWSSVSDHLEAHGWAMVKTLLTTSECEAVAGLYADESAGVVYRVVGSNAPTFERRDITS